MKRPVPALALTLAAAPALAQATSAQGPAPPAARAEVLVLGVYHMANPGRDIHNMRSDDVLAPKRQAEIGQLVEVLKRFRPTRVAVERDAFDSRIAKDYADYVAGSHELSRNEVEQIGFRVARELGHKAVYPVDAGRLVPPEHADLLQRGGAGRFSERARARDLRCRPPGLAPAGGRQRPHPQAPHAG
jgi:hypothetical protein